MRKNEVWLYGDSFVDDHCEDIDMPWDPNKKNLWSNQLKKYFTVMNAAQYGCGIQTQYSRFLGAIEKAKEDKKDLKNIVCIFFICNTQSRPSFTNWHPKNEYMMHNIGTFNVFEYIRSLGDKVLKKDGMEEVETYRKFYKKYHNFCKTYLEEVTFNPTNAFSGLTYFHSIVNLGSMFKRTLIIPIFDEPWLKYKSDLLHINLPENVYVTDFSMQDWVKEQPDLPGDKNSRSATANHLTSDNNQRILELIKSFIEQG